MEYKMLKFLGLCLFHKKYIIYRSHEDLFRLFWAFFSLLRLKSKIKNNHLFANKFCMVFSFVIQNDGSKSFFFFLLLFCLCVF